MFPQYSPPPWGLAQTPSQDVSPNDISGLVRWCNDSCEEFSIPERSGNNVIHRLAATLHKARCWNTGFNLLVSLRQSSAPAPCQRLAVMGRGGSGIHYREPPYQTPDPTLPISVNAISGALHLDLLDKKCLIRSGNTATNTIANP